MAKALKNPPATPPRKASGANTTMVASEEPLSGRTISCAASITTSEPAAPAAPTRRMMCSTITTASSTIRPTAAAMPPRVMMLKLMCKAPSSAIVIAMTIGKVSAVIRVMRGLRRNTNSTSAASNTPIRIASRTLAAEATISSDWS